MDWGGLSPTLTNRRFHMYTICQKRGKTTRELLAYTNLSDARAAMEALNSASHRKNAGYYIQYPFQQQYMI